MPFTTILIPWRNRPELRRALAHNVALLGVQDVAYLVVNYGGNSDLLDEIVASVDAPVQVVELNAEGFNKSRALNLGINFAQTPFVLVLDADILLHDFDLTRARSLCESGHFVMLGRVEESEPAPIAPGRIAEFANIIEIALTDGRRVRVETSRRHFDGDARSCPGIVFVARADLLTIDGFHSALVGWGWEDVDLQVRLGLLGRRCIEMGRGVHLTHGNDTRFFIGQQPADNNRRNQALSMARYDAGNLAGTLQADLEATLCRSALTPTR